MLIKSDLNTFAINQKVIMSQLKSASAFTLLNQDQGQDVPGLFPNKDTKCAYRKGLSVPIFKENVNILATGLHQPQLSFYIIKYVVL